MRFYQQNQNSITKQVKSGNKWVFILSAVGIIILLSAVIYLVHFSPVFKIKQINVSNYTGEKDVFINSLKEFYKSRSTVAALLGTENMLVWGSDNKKLLEIFPRFEALKISKNYSTRTINIFTKERQKFGIHCRKIQTNTDTLLQNLNEEEADTANKVNEPASDCAWFDGKGVLFVEAPLIDSELFYRVEDSTERGLKLGNSILSAELLENLIKIFKILDRAEFNTKTVLLENLNLQEVKVKSVSDPDVYFSLRFNPEFSLSAIDALKKSGKWDKISYVNFTVENRAYYK